MPHFYICNRRALALVAAVALFVFAAAAAAQDGRRWKAIPEDGVHDPQSPAAAQLQVPGNSLSKLPRGTGGNLVDWGQALEKGLITPRAGVDAKSGTKGNVMDGDIFMDLNGSMPPVKFPHRAHTQWLDCADCHPQYFEMQSGASKISKLRIQNGEQCGVCHSSVAFPLTECKRCHNTPWSQLPAAAGKR